MYEIAEAIAGPHLELGSPVGAAPAGLPCGDHLGGLDIRDSLCRLVAGAPIPCVEPAQRSLFEWNGGRLMQTLSARDALAVLHEAGIDPASVSRACLAAGRPWTG